MKEAKLLLAVSIGVVVIALTWCFAPQWHSRKAAAARPTLAAPEFPTPTKSKPDQGPAMNDSAARPPAAAEPVQHAKALPVASAPTVVAAKPPAAAGKPAAAAEEGGGESEDAGKTRDRDGAGGGEEPAAQSANEEGQLASAAAGEQSWNAGGGAAAAAGSPSSLGAARAPTGADMLRSMMTADRRVAAGKSPGAGAAPGAMNFAGGARKFASVSPQSTGGGAPPSIRDAGGARKYAGGDQPQDLATPGGAPGVGLTQEAGQGPKGGPSEDAQQRGAARADQAAAAAPAGPPVPVEYKYGPYALNNLDFYKGSKNPAPVVVFFHGGAFYRGDKADAKDYLSLLSRGYALASCNYRLISSPSQISGVALAAYDARNAVRWLKDNSGMLGIDPSRVVAVGASAGGYLSAMLGSAGDVGLADGASSGTSPAVQVVVDLAGPTDFGGMVIAPMQFVSGNDPPTLIRHGTADPVVSYTNSTNYAARLRSAGVRVDLKLYDGVGHEIAPSFREQLVKESLDFADSVFH